MLHAVDGLPARRASDGSDRAFAIRRLRAIPEERGSSPEVRLACEKPNRQDRRRSGHFGVLDLINPDEILERLRLAGEEWADKDAAANALEETKPSVLAELTNQADGSSEAQKKSLALADPSFKLHLAKMVDARKEANRSKVRYETGKIWAELVRTRESTKRAEMNNR